MKSTLLPERQNKPSKDLTAELLLGYVQTEIRTDGAGEVLRGRARLSNNYEPPGDAQTFSIYRCDWNLCHTQ